MDVDSSKADAAHTFLSTPSARRATGQLSMDDLMGGFLSTPSARRATVLLHTANIQLKISIHALREEGDATRAAG